MLCDGMNDVMGVPARIGLGMDPSFSIMSSGVSSLQKNEYLEVALKNVIGVLPTLSFFEILLMTRSFQSMHTFESSFRYRST